MGKKREEIQRALRFYEPDIETYPDDYFAFITCEEAYNSVKQGNYGIGSIMVSPSGDIICRGHNQVFKPYFQSDFHVQPSRMPKKAF